LLPNSPVEHGCANFEEGVVGVRAIACHTYQANAEVKTTVATWPVVLRPAAEKSVSGGVCTLLTSWLGVLLNLGLRVGSAVHQAKAEWVLA